MAILPEPGTQHFGVCAAALLVIVLLPVLAILDVSRKLAGWRLRRLRRPRRRADGGGDAARVGTQAGPAGVPS